MSLGLLNKKNNLTTRLALFYSKIRSDQIAASGLVSKKGIKMTAITIYHNPRCSKSRETLALLENKSANVVVINYLETPPTIEKLQQIIALLGFTSARQLMRTKEECYKTLALTDENNELVLLQNMVDHPKLIERPIVMANGKAAIGRPPESVLDII
ncbi:MAG: arsenate reductase [Psychromonas sp.]